MNVRGWSLTLLGLTLLASSAAKGQAPTSAKIESIPLELKTPDRYQVHAILEPVRHVEISAPVDGILRSLELPVGAAIRERQEIGQLDRSEAAARLKIAKANVKEAESVLKSATKGTTASTAIAQAQLEAAEARAELAQLDLERCTLRAPFSGRLLDVAVSPGQFLPKGAKVADLADVTSLRVMVPLDRATASVGGTVNLFVEGQDVAGKIQASLPLPESFAALREIATAFTAAWVIIPNSKGELEPGQRALSPSLPTAPIATIPARALHEPERGASGGPTIQVIRNEYVANIPVRILGSPGPERIQISGLLRANDALIVSSSVPLIAGTLIRFSGPKPEGTVEGTNPNPAEGGELAGITLPRGTGTQRPTAGTTNASRTKTNRPPVRNPANQPAAAKNATPF